MDEDIQIVKIEIDFKTALKLWFANILVVAVALFLFGFTIY